MIQLYPHQLELDERISEAYRNGARNVLAVSATGSGKTVLFSNALNRYQGPCVAIAHRQELVAQISQSLGRFGVSHNIIGPRNVVKMITQQHVEEFGRSYYNPSAQKMVAGVDTLLNRSGKLQQWCNSVGLWVQDEAHHVVKANKWGKAAELFPNAYGLGVTATPCRADGKGLGRHSDGLFDEMVVGKPERWLIDNGYLSDYRIFCPPSDLDLTNVDTSKTTGDYNPHQLHKSIMKSHLVGDIVGHYLKFAPGALGVTFVESVETAERVAEEYRARGVPALAVSAKTKDAERVAAIRDFRNRKLMQLVNCDLFGEGFDLPAIEVVSMGRPTQSYSLYAQQFGRALRVMKGKNSAIIIDHVGNVIRHGLIDKAHSWSLDAREKRNKKAFDPDELKLRACPDCTQPYESVLTACPYCGSVPVPADRSGPEFVDGDLFELSADVLAAMRAQVAEVDKPAEHIEMGLRKGGMTKGLAAHVAGNHTGRQAAQSVLREMVALWAGYQNALGRSDAEGYKRFYARYGVDVLTAQALNKADAEKLTIKICDDFQGLHNEWTKR